MYREFNSVPLFFYNGTLSTINLYLKICDHMSEKTDKQLELDKRYLRMAAIWAENSYCKRRQVGALIQCYQTLCSSCRGKCDHQGSGFVKQQQGCHHIHHLRPLYRMCQTHYSVGYQARRIFREIPRRRWMQSAIPCRH